MTQKTDRLKQEIELLRQARKPPKSTLTGASGYNVAITILTDLLGCIVVGAGIGLFLQYMFGTSVLLTAGLTLLGGVAGLYTTARYAMRLEKNK